MGEDKKAVPQGGAGTDEAFEKKVADAVDKEIRPFLQADGGDIQIVEFAGKTVRVRLQGHCCGCPHAMMTLKRGVEHRLRQVVDPEIVIESVPMKE